MAALGGLVALERHGEVPVLRVLQNLTSDDALVKELSAAIDQALGENGGRLVLDLSAIQYVASTTVGLLARTQTRLKRNGGRLVIVLAPRDEGILRVLKITRLNTIIDIVDSLPRALARYEAQPS